MEQVPAATSVSVLPLTVQTAGVSEMNDTGRPELAVAVNASGATPSDWSPGDANTSVCAATGIVPMAKLWLTGVAAAKLALPGWVATTVQVPAATSVSVVPLVVQTPGVDDERLTGKPELAVATNAPGALPSVWVPGELNWIVCAESGCAATEKLTTTGVAAA